MKLRILLFLADVRSRIAQTPVRGKDIYVCIALVAAGVLLWSLGRLSVIHEDAPAPIIAIENVLDKATESFACQPAQSVGEASGLEKPPKAPPAAGSVVGSKNSDKYHHPWCSGASRIKEENQRWFASEEDAKAAGYSKAGNCQ